MGNAKSISVEGPCTIEASPSLWSYPLPLASLAPCGASPRLTSYSLPREKETRGSTYIRTSSQVRRGVTPWFLPSISPTAHASYAILRPSHKTVNSQPKTTRICRFSLPSPPVPWKFLGILSTSRRRRLQCITFTASKSHTFPNPRKAQITRA